MKDQPRKSQKSRSKVVGTLYALEMRRPEYNYWSRVVGADYSFIEDATNGAQALAQSTGAAIRIVKIVTSIFREFNQISREHEQSHPV